jgi:membrane associated rhomboid family serine protease
MMGGVAYWAHIGGFVAGLVLVGLLAPRRRGQRQWWPDEYHPY